MRSEAGHDSALRGPCVAGILLVGQSICLGAFERDMSKRVLTVSRHDKSKRTRKCLCTASVSKEGDFLFTGFGPASQSVAKSAAVPAAFCGVDLAGFICA